MMNHQKPKLKRVIWVLVLLTGVVFLAWGGRLAWTGLSLRKHVARLQAMADAADKLHPAEAVDPVEACGLVRDLQGDVIALHRQAGLLIRWAPNLGWLPVVGGNLEAAPHLLAVADGLTEAGVLACAAVEPVLSASRAGSEVSAGLSLASISALLVDAQPDLKQALVATEEALRAWAQVDPERLSPWLAEKIAPLDRGVPLLWAGLKATTVAPDLMGMDEPRTYLILAQNEDELRPTGGFISGAGVLTLDGGQIDGLSFSDAYTVDDYLNKPYPEPPEPLLNYMGSELWLFRDANWSPDFPTSARQAARLYEYGQDVSVDGVIALDQHVLELLLTGFGEVRLPGTAQAVTADNVRQFMREVWNPSETGVTAEWVFSRKEFMGQLALALLERVENDPGSVDWAKVALGLYRALEGRHLLIFVDDADVVTALAQVGWDGSWREGDGDYLMVVDANLGFNKVNPLISEDVSYRVSLRADGTAAAELMVTYVHQGSKPGVTCQHLDAYGADLTYEALVHRCYYDYVRVYVPAGSVLRGSTPHPTPGRYLIRGETDDGQVVTLPDEAGKAVFAQFFVVEYGQTLTTRFDYDLPRVALSSDGQWRYALLIQKQPGTDSTPVSLMLSLPPGVQVLEVTPPPYSVEAGALAFDLDLASDVSVEVIYTTGD